MTWGKQIRLTVDAGLISRTDVIWIWLLDRYVGLICDVGIECGSLSGSKFLLHVSKQIVFVVLLAGILQRLAFFVSIDTLSTPPRHNPQITIFFPLLVLCFVLFDLFHFLELFFFFLFFYFSNNPLLLPLHPLLVTPLFLPPLVGGNKKARHLINPDRRKSTVSMALRFVGEAFMILSRFLGRFVAGGR